MGEGRRGRSTEAEVLALWREYKKSGDVSVRDRLVLTFAPMVKYIVYRKIREIPARCDVEDFISCGLEALIRSIDRYDPEKGATLEQFAWTRIHGAVLDELRRADWAPRSVRRWEREINRANERFVAAHGRWPTREELAESLETTVEELSSKIDDVAVSDVGSLNAVVMSDEDATIERIDTLESSDHRREPAASYERQEARERFREAFARLPERERQVAILLYVNGCTLREIGVVLGVSESRVCQIHGELKRRLRNELSADASLFSEVA